MTIGPVIFLAALLGLLLLALFVHLERTGRRMISVLVILWLLLMEAAIYPNPNLVPAGLFHPGVGSDPTGGDLTSSFRLPDVLVPLALAARMLGRGRPFRLTTASLWWFVFTSWLAAAVVIGIQNGNPSNLVSFEGKAIIYIGFFILVAGVPVSEYAHGQAFKRFLYGSAAAAAVGIVLAESKVRLSAAIPGLPIRDMGQMGADTATIYLTLGLITAAIAVCSETGRLKLLFATVPLLFASVVADQRAALIAMAISLALFVGLALVKLDRIRSTPTEFGVVAATFATLLITPILAGALVGKSEPIVPFVASVTANLTTQGKQLSAEDRRIQWAAARERIDEHPIMGSGLGTTYEHFDPGNNVFITTDITHNIGLDLLMRTGLIGLSFFLAAVAFTIRDGIRVWRNHSDAIVAAIALACTAALVGLIGKGMVESIFEKFRLSMLLGFLVGVVASAVLSLRQPVREPVPESRSLGRPGRPAWR